MQESVQAKKNWYMPFIYGQVLGKDHYTFQLKEDQIMWKKNVELCETKGYRYPTNLNKGAVHIPDWVTYGLPFDQDGKATLQECVDSSKTVNEDETREPSNILVRGTLDRE